VYAMFCEENFVNMITMYGADVDYIKANLEHHLKTQCDDIKTDMVKYKPKKTQTVERVLNRAFTQVLFAGRNNIELADVLLSTLSEKKVLLFTIWKRAKSNGQSLMILLIQNLIRSKKKRKAWLLNFERH